MSLALSQSRNPLRKSSIAKTRKNENSKQNLAFFGLSSFRAFAMILVYQEKLESIRLLVRAVFESPPLLCLEILRERPNQSPGFGFTDQKYRVASGHRRVDSPG